MLLVDGVRYEELVPQGPRAEDEFERVVKEHTHEIFGAQSIYIDRKQKLKSLSGIGSIPDGYVIILGDAPHWHIVEMELSSHPPHEHIVPQLSKFTLGIKNPSTQNNLVKAIYEYIFGDGFLTLKLKKATNCVDIYKFLSDLIPKPPVLTVIIEKKTKELGEALDIFRRDYQTEVVEFQTFTREGAETVHAHLFEPISKLVQPPPPPPPPPPRGTIEIKVTPASIEYGLIPLLKEYRRLFPGYDTSFTLITDIGEITTHVTGASVGTPAGDPDAGNRIQSNLKPWYQKHKQLKAGDKLIITAIEPMKKYRLEIVQ